LLPRKYKQVILIDAKHLEESDRGTFLSQYRLLSGVPSMSFENKIFANTALQNDYSDDHDVHFTVKLRLVLMCYETYPLPRIDIGYVH
jgi:hypothetical protein